MVYLTWGYFMTLIFDALKAKQREAREAFHENLGLRVHRGISWLEKAEDEKKKDPDAAFIFYWIAFNSLYSAEIEASKRPKEYQKFEEFFTEMLKLDSRHQLYDVVWEKFSGAIKLLLDNKFIYQPFWDYHNGDESKKDWEHWFNVNKSQSQKALNDHDTRKILTVVFDRLYTLRNQLMHGGATWNSSVNRGQVGDGVKILGLLVPIFIDLMMDNPRTDWGPCHYPVV